MKKRKRNYTFDDIVGSDEKNVKSNRDWKKN